MKRWWLLVLLILPAVAKAAIFDVPVTDKSMQFLGMIFGPVAGLPIASQGSAFFGLMMYLFNQLIFVLGISLIAYTTVVGAIHTAHEGKFLGEKWHAILTPLRAAIGLYLLLPSATGYNWIQIGVLWFIIQGVGGANALWSQVIIANATQGNLGQDTREADFNALETTIEGIFKCELCMTAINNDPTAITQLGEPIVAFRFGDEIQFGRISKQGIEEPLCGSIEIPTIGKSNTSADKASVIEMRKTIMADAISLAKITLEPSVSEALTEPSKAWNASGTFIASARVITEAVRQLLFTFQSLSSQNQQAIKDGWILAGSYYFKLVSGGSYKSITVDIPVTSFEQSQMTSLLGDTLGSALSAKINTVYKNYIKYAEGKTSASHSGSGGDIDIPVGNTKSSTVNNIIKKIMGPLINEISKVAEKFFSTGAKAARVATNVSVNNLGNTDFENDDNNPFRGSVSTSHGADKFETGSTYVQNQALSGAKSGTKMITQKRGDPLLSMANFGQKILQITEASFLGAIIAVFVVWLASSAMSGTIPLAGALTGALTILLPIIFLAIAILWTTGVLIGIYAPLVPYLVFSFAAFGWFILVIEAMLGASLIALTLIIPSEDEIGKAGHAIIILLSLFLRPMLMILGFIIAIKLLGVAIDMLNFGFFSTLKASTGNSTGAGLFALVSVIFLYASLCISIVHEAFSLIYVVPNKILVWLGAGAEGEDVSGFVREAKEMAEKGGEMGSGFMKGSISAAQDKAKARGSK